MRSSATVTSPSPPNRVGCQPVNVVPSNKVRQTGTTCSCERPCASPRTSRASPPRRLAGRRPGTRLRTSRRAQPASAAAAEPAGAMKPGASKRPTETTQTIPPRSQGRAAAGFLSQHMTSNVAINNYSICGPQAVPPGHRTRRLQAAPNRGNPTPLAYPSWEWLQIRAPGRWLQSSVWIVTICGPSKTPRGARLVSANGLPAGRHRYPRPAARL